MPLKRERDPRARRDVRHEHAFVVRVDVLLRVAIACDEDDPPTIGFVGRDEAPRDRSEPFEREGVRVGLRGIQLDRFGQRDSRDRRLALRRVRRVGGTTARVTLPSSSGLSLLAVGGLRRVGPDVDSGGRFAFGVARVDDDEARTIGGEAQVDRGPLGGQLHLLAQDRLEPRADPRS